ncbi:MAG TPA: DUF4167 domain-containing protein [Stellaceae bacterium]|jgi:hypothetical protein|nr:DUF4167 domain-containing protein [Stellaceae bacterium]
MHQDFKGVMRPGQNKRGRGRNHNPNNMGGGGHNNNNNNNNNNRGPRPPHRMQTFDSNGPSVKIRGNAYQVFERYIALAREASSAGDRIAAENLYQHAEHYYRIMQANGDGQNMGPPRAMTPADTEMNGMDNEGEFGANGQSGQPQQQGQPQQSGQPQPMMPETAGEDGQGAL